MSNYVHSIPGRLRVRCAGIKKNPIEAEKIRTLLGSVSGVRRLDINLVTGSVLIHYDSRQVSSDQLLHVLTQADYFQPSKSITHDDVDLLHSVLAKGGKAIGSLVVGALGDTPALAVLTALI